MRQSLGLFVWYGTVGMYKIDNKKRNNFLARKNPGNKKKRRQVVEEKTRGVEMSRSKTVKGIRKMQEKKDDKRQNHCNKKEEEKLITQPLPL